MSWLWRRIKLHWQDCGALSPEGWRCRKRKGHGGRHSHGVGPHHKFE